MKNSSLKSIQSSGIFSVAFAVPWCCVLPAVLAVFGLAGTAAMRVTLIRFTPIFLLFSAFFLVRANYLVLVRKQGNRMSHLTVWLSTLVAFGLWLPWLSMI